MVAPCHEDNDAPEHTAITEFFSELSTSGVHGGVELCALIAAAFNRSQTVAVASVIQKQYLLTMNVFKVLN